MRKIGAVILAGGNGTRFGEKKQFIIFKGKELWLHVYDKLLQLLPKNSIVVVGVDVQGGKTRSGSVINGLAHISPDTDKVLLVEAARPLVTIKQLQQLIDCNAKSISFVQPLVNTVIGRDGTYYNRGDMWDLLTPQAFDFKMLKKAYDSGKFNDMTDETRVMYEYFGIKPTFIETTSNLVKITYKKDIPILEDIYDRQQRGEI